MTFDEWKAKHDWSGATCEDDARAAWDAAVLAERERIVKLIKGGEFPQERAWEAVDVLPYYRSDLLAAIRGAS